MQGEDLDLAATSADYSIWFNEQACNITRLERTLIVCEVQKLKNLDVHDTEQRLVVSPS